MTRKELAEMLSQLAEGQEISLGGHWRNRPGYFYSQAVMGAASETIETHNRYVLENVRGAPE